MYTAFDRQFGYNAIENASTEGMEVMIRTEDWRKVLWFKFLENTIKYFDREVAGQQPEISLVHGGERQR